MLDGVYRHSEGAAIFHEVAAPTIEELHALLAKIITRIMRLLTRQGFLIEEQGMTYLAEADRDQRAFAPASGLMHLPHRARAASGTESAELAKRAERRQTIHAGAVRQTRTASAHAADRL